MPAAYAVGMIVSSIVSAKIASNAAKKAAATQSAGADRALQAQQENFNRVAQVGQEQSAQAQAQFDPYNQMSQNAMSALYQRLGMPQPPPQQFRPPSGLSWQAPQLQAPQQPQTSTWRPGQVLGPNGQWVERPQLQQPQPQMPFGAQGQGFGQFQGPRPQ